jgi:hypothetical protein
MRHYSMTNSKRASRLLASTILLALGAVLTACDRAPPRAPDAQTSAVPPPAASPAPVRSVTEGAKSAELVNANDQPMKSMTKEEESTSMPQPGQANDHSTLAKDSKK